MHALTRARRGRIGRRGLATCSATSYAALSVSIEDADAGSADEQPVFDEPGVAGDRGWQRARISALFADEAAATAAAAALAASAPDATRAIESIAPVDERDWVRLTQAQFGPIEIEPGFWIVPTWSDVPRRRARRVIRLDPGMAFGTGTHPTTRMCLRWIARHGAAPAPLAARARLRLRLGRARDRRRPVRRRRRSTPSTSTRPRSRRPRANAARQRRDARAPAGRRASPDALRAGPRQHPGDAAEAARAAALGAGSTPAARWCSPASSPARPTSCSAAYAPWLALDVADEDDGWILMTGARPAPTRVA